MNFISLISHATIRIKDRWFRNVTLPRYLSKLRQGDVVIDCGANVGEFTELFAKTGATVYAFEPHPAAFAKLERRLRTAANVHCINKAVSSKEGRMKLYLRPDDTSISATQSASLMEEKENVSTSHFVEVDVIRLADFIRQLEPIRFLKMDIEGAEYQVLSDLFDTKTHRFVDFIVVETHERNPGLYPRHAALVERIRAEGVANVDLNWH